jgi:hypothetical protein
MTKEEKRALIYYGFNEESVFLEAATFAESNDLTLIGEFGDIREDDGSDMDYVIDGLMYWIEEEEVEHIMITSLVAFGRNVIEAIKIKDELHSMGVCVWLMNTCSRTLNDDGTVNEIAEKVFTLLKENYYFENKNQ